MKLTIESRLPEAQGRSLRHHKFPEDYTPTERVPVSFEGTVGAVAGEPYAIVFENASADAVEVRFTIDGNDILTGKPADLSLAGQRMLVRGRQTIKLEAWPESHAGGARFVFAPEGMAVADHRPTGSPKGIISAAVFVEGAPRPRHNILRSMSFDESMEGSLRGATMDSHSYGGPAMRGGSPTKGMGTGAGEYVAQELVSAQGLSAPRLGAVYVIKVVAWDDLRARLAPSYVSPAPSALAAFGFPAEKGFTGPDLSGIPRMPSVQTPTRLV